MEKSKAKRAVKDIPIFLDKVFQNLNQYLGAPGWNYKTNMEALEFRDRALFSLLVLSGGRASEIGPLKKIQINDNPAGSYIANFETVKNGLLRKEIILPRTGALSIYADILIAWAREAPYPEAHIIPAANSYGSLIWSRGLGRKRIWQIIRERTGLFPHWFRGVHETVYGRLVFRSDAWKLKDHMGLKRLDSTAPYVRGELEAQDLKRLKSL